MSRKNPDLLAVSMALNELATRIHERKEKTEDPAQYSALNKELIEINHRITMVGGLIFRARSEDIAEAAQAVSESKDEIARGIEEIESMNQLIQNIAGFLGLVDKVIDLAKLV
jgi:hypothetical protein